MKTIACLSACAFVFLASSPVQATTPAGKPPSLTHVTAMLDWLPNAAHSGLYVAMARGYMKAKGIAVKVEVPSDTSDPAKLVGAGSVTFADADIGDVVTAKSVGVGITAVMALVQHPLEAILSLKSSHITRPSQLQGHTIGISGDPADYAILDSMVLADHGNPKKVKTS